MFGRLGRCVFARQMKLVMLSVFLIQCERNRCRIFAVTNRKRELKVKQ